MSVPRVHSAVLIAALAGSTALLVRAPQSLPHATPEVSKATQAAQAAPPRDLLEAFPVGAAFVLTADVEAIRSTELGAALALEGQLLPGVGQINVVCGFDPVRLLKKLALVVPEDSATSEFGVAAQGSFNAEAVATCVQKVVRKRGGTPAVGHRGSFTLVSNQAQPASGTIAVQPGGPVLLSEGAHLHRLIDLWGRRERGSTVGRPAATSVALDPHHAPTRKALGEGGALVASGYMTPARWATATGSELVRLSSLAAVDRVGARIDFGTGLRITGIANCPDDSTCKGALTELKGIIDGLAPAVKDSLGIDLMARARLEQKAKEIRLSLELEQKEAAALLSLALTQAGAP